MEDLPPQDDQLVDHVQNHEENGKETGSDMPILGRVEANEEEFPEEREQSVDSNEHQLANDHQLEEEKPLTHNQNREVTSVRRLVRRVINQDVNVDDDEPSSSMHSDKVHHFDGAPPPKKIYVRRKRTPEELIAHDRDLLQGQQRIPGAPGRRGRRPIAPRVDGEPLSRTEAARRTGRPTVLHPSGIEFAIPISLEAHPIPLSDTIPDNAAYDILRDDKGMPYCTQCHSVLKSWHAFEYHVMNAHLKYRPYRCMYCVKEYFYTEEECLSHLKSTHAGKPLNFIRELNAEKEAEANKYFQAMFIMIREGEDFNEERVVQIQQSAFHHMQRFHRMRFKVPEVIARQRSQRDATAQTFVTMASPQTMVTAPVKMPQHHYRRDHGDMMDGGIKMVRLVSGEYARVIPDHGEDAFLVDRDLEVDADYDHDQIDVVDQEMQHHGGVHYR